MAKLLIKKKKKLINIDACFMYVYISYFLVFKLFYFYFYFNKYNIDNNILQYL